MKKPIKPAKPSIPKKPEEFSIVTEKVFVRIYDGDNVMEKIREIQDKITSFGMIFDIEKVYLDSESSYYEDYETFLKYQDPIETKIPNLLYDNQLKVYNRKLPIYKAKLELYNKAMEKYESGMKEYQRLVDLNTIEQLKKRGLKIELQT